MDNYLFNFPDTSFAWAFALAVMAGALAARKRIAWWVLVVILVVAVGFDVVSLTQRADTRFERVGEYLGLGFHIASIVVLVLARGEFWARVRRGALLKAAAVLVAGNVVGILLGWGLVELFPGSLQPDYRLAYTVNRVSGFATAALLSSVSPLIRHLTSAPREFIDNYLFNFPDTSFAWAFALAVMAGA
ncbi:MAG: lysine--tRNA ligase, partial [Mycobacteriaceae bacterium]|nr:lysine--tRNA ligase [Mycobacteriaceae bacterium]